MADLLAAQAQGMAQAWLHGNAPTEAERLALLRVREWVEDFFECTFDEMKAVVERTRG